MQIVIDIDENVFTRLFDNGTEDYEIVNDDLFAIAKSIRKGTPIPKGHGRIIDESQVTGTFTWDNGYIECYAPTIIETDKEESLDVSDNNQGSVTPTEKIEPCKMREATQEEREGIEQYIDSIAEPRV